MVDGTRIFEFAGRVQCFWRLAAMQFAIDASRVAISSERLGSAEAFFTYYSGLMPPLCWHCSGLVRAVFATQLAKASFYIQSP